MKAKYLGETPIDIKAHPRYRKWGPAAWAMLWIEKYGQIDGEHHKAWVLDQVARILLGVPVIAVTARWSDGTSEERFSLAEPNRNYLTWTDDMKGAEEEDGSREYSYDAGTAP